MEHKSIWENYCKKSNNNIKIIKIELIILVLIKCPPSFNKLIY